MGQVETKEMSGLQKHKWSWYTPKKVRVDRNILPVVKWIESFPDLKPRWSCEEPEGRPYVIFYADAFAEVVPLIQKIEHYQGMYVHVDWNSAAMSIRYTLKFCNTATLNYLSKAIQEGL